MTKFGAILQRSRNPRFGEGAYISYKALKKLLKRHLAEASCADLLPLLGTVVLPISQEDLLTSDSLANEPALFEEVFFSLLADQTATLNETFLASQRCLQDLAASIRDEGASMAHEQRRDLLLRFKMESAELMEFAELNYLAIYKIVKKFDKQTGSARLAKHMRSLDSEPFFSLSFGGVLERVECGSLHKPPSLHALQVEMESSMRYAAVVTRSAVNALLPQRTEGEQDQLRDRQAEVRTESLANLQAELEREPRFTEMTLAEIAVRTKLDVFQTLLSDLTSEVELQNPEAAAALNKLGQAHSTLFAAQLEAGVPAASPRGTSNAAPPSSNAPSSWTESDKLSSGSNDAIGAGASLLRWCGLGMKATARRLLVPHIIVWLPEYLRDESRNERLKADLLAGLTIAIMVIPQGLAYATLAGLEGSVGIMSAIVPALVYSLLGTSRQLAVGPMSVPCLFVGFVTDAALARPQWAGFDRLTLTLCLTAMSGLILLLVGVLKAGWIVSFISKPVLQGFSAAAGLITTISVTKDLLGIQGVKKSPYITELLPRVVEKLPNAHLPTLLVSTLCVLTMFGLKMLHGRKAKKNPKAEADSGAETGQEDGVFPRSFELMPTSGPREVRTAVSSGDNGGRRRCDLAPFRQLPPVLVFVMVWCFAGAAMCAFRKPDNYNADEPASGDQIVAVWAHGAGATLPSKLYTQAAGIFNCIGEESRDDDDDDGVMVDYEAIGSGAGQAKLSSGEVDFCGTDVPFTAPPEGLVYSPTVGTSVCPFANLHFLNRGDSSPSSDGGTPSESGVFVLSLPVLAAIFRGNITRWSDERIVMLNPGFSHILLDIGRSKNDTITVVVRNDRSGTTAIFRRGMAELSAPFDDEVGRGVGRIEWGSSAAGGSLIHSDYNSGVAALVEKTPMSIGYSTASHTAGSDGLGCNIALAQNEPGHSPLLPSTANVETTLESTVAAAGAWAPVDVQGEVLAAIKRGQIGLWPFTSFTYMAWVGANSTGAERGEHGAMTSTRCRRMLATNEFAMFVVDDERAIAAVDELGLVPLPRTLRTRVSSNLKMAIADIRSICQHSESHSMEPETPMPEPSSPITAAPSMPGNRRLRASERPCDGGEDTGSGDSHYASCLGVKIVGEIPPGLAAPLWPFSQLFLEQAGALLFDAIFLSILLLMESMAVAKLYAMQNSYDIDPSAELVALGTANLVGPIFSSFAVAGAFGRSAVNSGVGATSQLALLSSAVFLSILMFFVQPLLYFLPKAALSTVVVFAVIKLIDLKQALQLWRCSRADFGVWLTAFAATLLFGVVLGIAIALGLSMVLFVYFSTRPRICALGRLVGTVTYVPLLSETKRRGDATRTIVAVRGTKILRFEAPLFFANAESLRIRVTAEVSERRRQRRLRWAALVLDFSAVSWIDVTAAGVLRQIALLCASEGIQLYVAAANKSVTEMLSKSGLAESGEGVSGGFFSSVHLAVRRIAEVATKNKKMS